MQPIQPTNQTGRLFQGNRPQGGSRVKASAVKSTHLDPDIIKDTFVITAKPCRSAMIWNCPKVGSACARSTVRIWYWTTPRSFGPQPIAIVSEQYRINFYICCAPVPRKSLKPCAASHSKYLCATQRMPFRVFGLIDRPLAPTRAGSLARKPSTIF